MAKRGRKRLKRIALLAAVAAILAAAGYALFLSAESKANGYFIDAYILPEGLYATHEEAAAHTAIIQTNWGIHEFCVLAEISKGEGPERISTTISLSVPTVSYVLGKNVAPRMVGSC